MIIVSDTSPIASLIVIDQLDILRLVFDEIIVPPFVNEEIMKLAQFNYDLKSYTSCDWIHIQVPSNPDEVKLMNLELDLGESEAISLGLELKADYLLIDERIGTKKANEVGLQTIGLLGVIVKAKEKKHLEKVKPIISKLREDAGFWVSDKLVELILRRVGEL